LASGLGRGIAAMDYRVEPAKSNRFGSPVDMAGHTSYTWRDLKCITQKQANNVLGKLANYTAVSGFDDLADKQKVKFEKAFAAALAGKHDAAKKEAKAALKAGAKAGAKSKAKAKAKGKAKAKSKGKVKAKAKGKANVIKLKLKAKAKAVKAVKVEKAAERMPMPSAAAQHGFLDAAKRFDWKKVRALVQSNPGYVNCQPGARWTALHQAAQSGSEEIVRFLVARGASLSIKSIDGQTPHDVAHESVKALVVPLAAARLPEPPVRG